MQSRPKFRDDLVFRTVDEDYVVYDRVSDKTILLNLSAAVVLELCDGEHTVDEIIDAVAETFSITADRASADVSSTLKDLERQGLLVP